MREHGLLRSAGTVSAAVAVSRLTGMAREMIMARFFGAGEIYDAYLVGFRIPNLARNLFAEGALSAAFVPIFSQYLETRGPGEAKRLSDLTCTALLAVVGAFCAAGMFFAPELVRLMAPGFEQTPAKFALSVQLTRIMFPFLVLVALAAQAMGVLNAAGRFGIPASASIFFNVGSVIAGVGLMRTVSASPIVCMAVGVLAGGALQLAWQLPSVWREGFSYRPRVDLSDPGLRRIAALMAPAFIGSAALQINSMVSTYFASQLTDAAGNVLNGPVSWMNYAFRFLQLPLGVFGVALASVTLPRIARSAAVSQLEEFRGTLAQSVGTALVFTVPSSIGLAILGESMIALVYQGGRFHAADTRETAASLACYSVGLAGYALIKILAPAFYALGDARTPMLVSVASVILNAAISWTLVTRAGMGHPGLALSISMVALLGAAALFELLRRRIGGLDGRRIASSAIRILAASALMAAACLAAQRLHLAPALNLAVSLPLGVAVFYGAARVLRIREVEAIRTACYTPLRDAPRPEVGDPPARHR
ncbi:MAG: integral rane protein MviN [Microvirga sp.]|nr:integral rane protein MviN [Microvirga sp.]